jgi:hypothetical protein
VARMNWSRVRQDARISRYRSEHESIGDEALKEALTPAPKARPRKVTSRSKAGTALSRVPCPECGAEVGAKKLAAHRTRRCPKRGVGGGGTTPKPIVASARQASAGLPAAPSAVKPPTSSPFSDLRDVMASAEVLATGGVRVWIRARLTEEEHRIRAVLSTLPESDGRAARLRRALQAIRIQLLSAP